MKRKLRLDHALSVALRIALTSTWSAGLNLSVSRSSRRMVNLFNGKTADAARDVTLDRETVWHAA
jgi:hypothetical protein